MLLIGAASLILFFATLKRFTAPTAAVAATSLLATDPAWLLATTYDWGPVAIQTFLTIAVVYCGVESRFVLAGFLAGLLMWDKALSVFVLAGLAVALAVVGKRADFRGVGGRNLLLAGIAFTVGALPLLYFNLTHGGETLIGSSHLAVDQLLLKWWMLLITLGGWSLFPMLTPATLPPFTTLTPLLLLLAVAAFASRPKLRNRTATFALVGAGVSWLLMLAVRDVGIGAHHIVLLSPLVFAFISSSLGPALRPRVLTALVVVGVGLNFTMLGAYRRAITVHGTNIAWSDATSHFHGVRMGRLIAIDWGIANPYSLLQNAHEADFKRVSELTSEEIRTQKFISHVDGSELVRGSNRQLDIAADALSLYRSIEDFVSDRHGKPVFMIFRYEPGFRRP